MTKRLLNNVALACVVCLLSVLLCGYAAIDNEIPRGTEEITYEKVPVYVDGVLEYSGYVIDDCTYIPFRSFCSALDLGIIVSWDSETAIATGLAEGYTLSAEQDAHYITVNDRYFYTETGVVNYRDNILVAVRVLCDAFNIEVEWDEETGSINLITDGMQVCTDGGEFYDEEDLYWLARIINAEARNQSMEGKIGVGNVVLNRVENDRFPDSVYDVIFDTTYGVQFSPVTTGSIYNAPNEEALVAAKLCLEGYELVGDSLYFVNPSIGDTNWFMNNCAFVTSTGDHDFYA